MNVLSIFAQTDVYERATMLFVVLALIVLPFIGKWIAVHGEEHDERTIAMFLAGMTAVGTAIVIVCALLGPHPS
ncbi:MAG TPA: hypothetical protein VMD07_00095 [Candidatus Acidoferrales bacterium]|nr:hypothetical protein [Candidatus Acidoferrales bacterium]